jgi:hypothetical protein
MRGAVQFCVWVVKVGIYLALAGQLKDATMDMMGRAYQAQKHMISYSQFSRQLTGVK